MASNCNDVHGSDDDSFVSLFVLIVSVMTIVISITLHVIWVCIVNRWKQLTQVKHHDVTMCHGKNQVNTVQTWQHRLIVKSVTQLVHNKVVALKTSMSPKLVKGGIKTTSVNISGVTQQSC